MIDVPTRFAWEAQSSADLTELINEQTVAILPVAATEQHGPHLPLGVDTYIMDGLLKTLCQLAKSEGFFTILPTQSIGKSDEHLYAKGTLSLPANLAMQSWVEIGTAVASSGIRKLLIVTSHGGNIDVMGIVARELRIRTKMLVGKTYWSAFGFPEGLFDQAEIDAGIHGGDVETSLMLHFRSDLVNLTKAQNFQNAYCEQERANLVGLSAPVSLSWIASDLNFEGVVGDATAATAEKGKLLADYQAEGMFCALKEMRNMEPPRI